jgi:hypothetical protein
MAVGQDGLPAFDKDGGLWIKLRICGVTRLGYGDSQGKRGGNAVKEAIGDALRNAGMRFGAALDLWHKGDLHDAEDEKGREDTPTARPVPAGDAGAQALAARRHEQPNWDELLKGARNNRDMLLDLLTKAQNMNAPQTVIDGIKAAGKALQERSVTV